MVKARTPAPRPKNDEIRRIMLEYFYNRNNNATSTRGKKGSSVKISDIRKDLKASHGLTQQEALSNLTYLLSEGWIEEDRVEKSFPTPRGTLIPSTTSFYRITAQGIDKIEGPGEFTMAKFHGIRIEATGQNIITVGDGNQVNAKFGELGQALAELRDAVTGADNAEAEKMNIVADIETIQTQLAKPEPNRVVVKAAWDAIKAAAVVNGFAALVAKVTALIHGLL